jgi:hypothetical protein
VVSLCKALYNTHVSLFVLRAHTVAFQHSKLAVQEQVAKAFDTVTFPVFYKRLELLDSFDTFFAGNGVVCASQYGRGCIDTSGEVFLPLLVEVTVLLQLLRHISIDQTRVVSRNVPKATTGTLSVAGKV